MTVAVVALLTGFIFLALSADKFVEGAAVMARHLGIPPLLVGMLIIGFGSSMPEFVVSVLAAMDGSAGLALGNAIGSNISNIALILGVTALITPIAVKSSVLHSELPVLIYTTMVCTLLLSLDGVLSRGDGWIMMTIFGALMAWTIYIGLKTKTDELGDEVEHAIEHRFSLRRAVVYLVAGMIVLIFSSRLLVWGGVEIAHMLGISDTIIGLTIVAIGTSLPELASALAAVKHREHDLALGNVIGSNMFNTTLVIGVAGAISPTTLDADMITRDIPIMIAFTFLLFASCYSLGGRKPSINRTEGIALLVCYVAYYAFLLSRILV